MIIKRANWNVDEGTVIKAIEAEDARSPINRSHSLSVSASCRQLVCPFSGWNVASVDELVNIPSSSSPLIDDYQVIRQLARQSVPIDPLYRQESCPPLRFVFFCFKHDMGEQV